MSLALTAAVPPGLLPAREQMALSLGWHIVLACFGVAFPAMIFVMHRRAILRDDPVALELAKRWSKVSAVLFAIGAVSGTVLSFEFGLLWPGLMGRFGDVLGLPFGFEGLSFFIEAIFLGMYLYGWGRLQPRVHLLMLIPMAFAGVFGTFCVISVNAWMNWPTGFKIVDGRVTDVHPWQAMFNDRAWLEFAHMWVAAFMVVGFLVAGVYAVGMLRGRRDEHHRLGFIVPFTFASVAAVVQPAIGHVLGFGMASNQPSKLASFEYATTTTSGASPLRLGGIYLNGQVHGAIDIPWLGSLFAMNSFTKPVPGLDRVPVVNQPNAVEVNTAHWAFQSMVGVGTLIAVAVVVFWLARWKRRDLLAHSWFLRLAAVAGPAAVVALECGWTATEVGRQPWVVFGYLKTTAAASTHEGLWWFFGASLLVYSAMTVGAVMVIRSMTRRWRAGETDLLSPYGPAEVAS